MFLKFGIASNEIIMRIVLGKSENLQNKTYWFQKSPRDRLIALEYLRQVMYGYDPNTTRLGIWIIAKSF